MREIVQSRRDSPCRVRFGGEGRRAVPNVNLSKWSDRAYLNLLNRRAASGRVLREGSGELLLSGGDEAHRYRRLDGERFEYDVILLERPRRPVVSLELRFPKGLEFYRQRTLSPGERRTVARDPFVEGSYAVYWRERGGEFRTGKLCHIYRPRLVDSAGASVWGELDLHDSTLDILLPERWLKRARYPVTVDPIIGSSSVGASHLIQDGADWVELRYELSMAVNRYQAPATVRGACVAYFYCYYHDSEAAGIPAVYADSGGLPAALLSSGGQIINFDTPAGVWRSGTFNLANPIQAGQYLWFGAQAHYQFLPYFDDGGTLAVMDTTDYDEPPASFVALATQSRILSMYFSYTASQTYAAAVADIVGVADACERRQWLTRDVVEVGSGITAACRVRSSFARRCLETVGAADVARRITEFVRSRTEAAAPAAATSRRGSFLRRSVSSAAVTGTTRRGLRIALRILEGLRLWDYIGGRTLATYEVVTLSSRVTRELVLDSRL